MRYPYTTNTPREPRKFALKRFPHIRSVPSQYFQYHSPNTGSRIILHKTSAQRDYLLDIATSGILDMNKEISKATATKQSGNQDRWCTFLTHTGIKTITGRNATRIQSNPGSVIPGISAKKSVFHNKEIQTPTRKIKSLCIICIYFLPDAPLERIYPRRVGKKKLILQ